MKSTVNQSAFSFIVTIVVIGALIIGLCASYGTDKFIILSVITIALLCFCMFYAPLSISANEEVVTVSSPFKIHSIAMKYIVSVERFKPTMGSLRLCGSGGFMGYWGIFREGDVGLYMAYYGKASDCFLLRLNNGDRYVLGCKDADAMVAYIKEQICR
jgi:hypothetical protein